MKRRILASLLIAIMVLNISPMGVYAETAQDVVERTVVASGDCSSKDSESNVMWSLDDLGRLTISGAGEMATFRQTYDRAPWIYIKDQITEVIVQEGVLSLSPYSFEDCTKLVSVKLADSVASIGTSAFSGCSSLTTLTLPENLGQIQETAFFRCSKLSKVVLPDTITRIGRAAFSNCSALEEIEWPASLTSIGEDAFYGCTRLTKLELPEGVTSIDNEAFYNCSALEQVSLGKKLTSIANQLFYGCSSLKEIVLPDTVTMIGEDAFRECTNLEKVDFSAELTNIGERSFLQCSKLKELILPSQLKQIDSSAFEGCTGLTNIYVPKSLTKIADDFYIEDLCTVTYEGTKENWLAIKGYYIYKNKVTCSDGVVLGSGESYRLYVSDELTWMFDSAGVLTIVGEGKLQQYQKAPWYKFRTDITEVRVGEGISQIGYYEFQDYSALKKISLPSTLTTIGDYIFEGCSSLESIVIPDNVTSIGTNAFSKCTKLTEITLPSKIDSIPDNMFKQCSALKSITIPENVTSIGASAFNGCSALEEITLPEKVTTIGAQAFSNCTNIGIVTMPEDMTKIEDSTFAGCNALENIVLPKQLISIGPKAFDNCTLLKRLDFSDTLQKIDSTAFAGCTGIVNVFYAGTNEMWDKIGYKFNVGVTCSDGKKEATGTCGTGLTWTIYTNENYGRLVITGSGWMDNYDETNPAPWSKYTVTQVLIQEGIRTIGSSAFEGCTQIERIVLPDSITEIKAYAFYNCTSLKEIEIPEKVTAIGTSAFEGCTALTKVTVYEKLLTIESSAFNKCKALTLYGYGKTVIEEYATRKNIPFVAIGYMGSCGDSVNWLLKDGVLSITGKGKMTEYSPESPAPWQELQVQSCTIGAGVTSVGDYAFLDCKNLESITLTNDIMDMGSHAFENCSSLLHITVPTEITILREAIFKNCTSLQTMELPDSVITIEDYAFAGCKGLTRIALPSELKTVNEGILADCEQLTDIILGAKVLQIKPNAFANTAIKTITIPKTVTEIAKNAFDGCMQLTEYTVEEENAKYLSTNGILYIENGTKVFSCPMGKTGSCTLSRKTTVIGEYAFQNCTGITGIVIPNGLTDIGEGAFENTAITEIEFPAEVTSIPISAFANCNQLASILVDTDNANYGSLNGMLTNKSTDSILYCPMDIKDVTVPEGVTTICKEAFTYVKSNTTIDLPYSLVKIPEDHIIVNDVVLKVYTNSDAYDYAVEKEYSYQSKGDYTVSWNDSDAHHIARSYKKLEASLKKEPYQSYTCYSYAEAYKRVTFTMTYADNAIECKYSYLEDNAITGVKKEYMTFTLDRTGVLNNKYTFEMNAQTGNVLKETGVATYDSSFFQSTDSDDAYTFAGLKSSYSIIKSSAVLKSSLDKLKIYLTRAQLKMKDLGFTSYDGEELNSIHELTTVGQVDATCTKDGYSGDSYCSICGASHEGRTLSATGHKEVKDEAVKPTCTKAGRTEGSHCSVCGVPIKESQVLQATGHKEVKDEAVKPTCTKTGRTEGSHCSVCGVSIKESQVLQATGHKEVKDEAVEPTCTKTGRTEGSHCSICGAVVKAQKTLEALGHNYETKVIKATLTANGKVEKRCSRCHELESSYTVYFPKTITLSASNYLYNGRVQKPVVKVVDSRGAIINASNYTVTYPTGCIAPGTYTVTITFKNNYSGKVYRSYKIGLAKTNATLLNTTTGMYVKWTKVAGARGYYIYRKTGSGSYVKIKTITNGATIAYTDTTIKNNNGTLYTYAVVPFAGSVSAAYTGTVQYRLTHRTISSLKNSSKGKLTIKWNKISKISGYELQYSTSAGFGSGTKTVTINSASSSSKTISGLKKNKTYYVRIRTYKAYGDKKQYSAWSPVKKLKISK